MKLKVLLLHITWNLVVGTRCLLIHD